MAFIHAGEDVIPSHLHLVWLGGKPLPTDNFIKFTRMHRNWNLSIWDEKNIHELDLTPEQIYHDTYAGSSNIIRLAALYKMGGVYLDVDVEPVKSLNCLLTHKAFIARQPDGVFCNACLGAAKGHPWIKQMLDKCVAEQRKHDAAWACHLVSRTNMEDVTELPTDTFYPYNWDEKPKPPTERTLAIHHWDKSWLKH